MRSMLKTFTIGVLCLLCLPHTGLSQIVWNGQTAAMFLKSPASESQRAVNRGRPSFGWESELFADGTIGEHAAAYVTIRAAENQSIGVDYAAVRLTDLTPLHLNIQAGRFDLPFGNLGERRYPRRNSLYSLPLLYEYQTALPDHLTSDMQIRTARGKGGGMPVLDGGVYDLGAMIFGSWGPLDYAVAVSSGTVSSTTYGGQNNNSEVGTVFRLALTPFTGLILGAAFAQGPFMDEPADAPTPGVDVNQYRQRTAEIDLEYSVGHAVFYGEAVMNRWPTPLSSGSQNLDVFGYYVEGKYTLMPRLYVAVRANELLFNRVMLDGQVQPWDRDVAEFEAGLGFFLDRDILLKLVRRESRIFRGPSTRDGLSVLQLLMAY
jgi:hypothetical protein